RAFAYAHCYFLASGMTVGNVLWLSLLSRTEAKILKIQYFGSSTPKISDISGVVFRKHQKLKGGNM
ncbi:MAG: hypothetical protein WCG04_06450, partial [Alphaproteobacteria bacterium]